MYMYMYMYIYVYIYMYIYIYIYSVDGFAALYTVPGLSIVGWSRVLQLVSYSLYLRFTTPPHPTPHATVH